MNDQELGRVVTIPPPLPSPVRTAYWRFAAAIMFATLCASGTRAQQQGYAPAIQDPQAIQDAQQVGQLVDPPSRVARLSVLQGNVSFQAASAPDFAAAELNYPLTSGDRLYTDNGSRAELEAGQLTLRLGATADATVTSLTDDIAQFGLAQGSAHLRAYALDPDTTTEIDTPNASIGILAPGDYRVDVYPQGANQPNVTVVTVFSGQVQVNADGVQQTLNGGQSFQVTGSGYNGNPAQAQLVRRQRPDELDQFSAQRDALYQQQLAQNGQNVNPGTIGYADLGQYGDWQQAPPPDAGGGDDGGGYSDGPVWFPRNVAVDWQPYRVGHWAYIAPWGWTWVEAEPWGFAPFHYGRWSRFGNRWGWIPGPPVIHPVYSPALVVFVGGANFHLSIGGGGGGVAAWFPLGPREVYQPPYRTGPGYINRINVTNIYTRNTVEVRNIYNNRTVNVYQDGGPGRPGGPGGRPVIGGPVRNGPPQYVNRNIATVAVPQDKFAGGRPVAANAIHVDPRQFANAPIQNRPPVGAVRPGTNPAAPANPARALPPVQSRPVLANQGPAATQNPGNRGGFNRGGNNNPGNNPGAHPGPAQPAPTQNAPIERPAPAPAAPANNNNSYRRGPVQAPPQQPTAPAAAPAPAAPSNNNYRRGPLQAPPQQPTAPAAAPAPATPAAPANNNYRRGPLQAAPQQPTAPATAPTPAPPSAPSNNNYRRGPVQQPAPAQPAPAPAAASPAPPVNNNLRRGPVQQPAPQQPAPTPAPPVNNNSRRDGPTQAPRQPQTPSAPAPQPARPAAPAAAAPAKPAPPAAREDRRPEDPKP